MSRRPARHAGSGPRTVAYLHDNIEFGGIETLQLHILRHLDPDRYRGIVVVAEYSRAQASRFREQLAALDVRLLAVPPPPHPPGLHALHTVWRLHQLLREARADVAHVQTRTPVSGRRLTVGAAMAGIPAIVRTEHISPGSHFRRSSRLAVKPLDWLTDLIITDSKADARLQVEVVGRPPSKVVSSYCGIDPFAFDANHDVAAAKARVGLDPAVTVVGAVGRLHEQKGHRYLIEAMALLLAERNDPMVLLLVGDGPEEAALRAQVEAAGISGQVHFAGFQSDAGPFMEAMDVVAMPSLWEGFSISMQEFMALAKPMVVSDHHSFKEALVDGEHGVIVPTRDSAALAVGIAKLLDDETLRVALGRAAAERVRREFNIENHVSELMALYDALLGTRAAGRRRVST